MRKFESVIILKPELLKDEIKEIIKRVELSIGKVAKITDKKELGVKRLAYDIKGCKEGYYVVHQFEIEKNINNYADSINGIEKYFRTQEEIIRFIMVERD